jgi:hypothetical protein
MGGLCREGFLSDLLWRTVPIRCIPLSP